MTRRDFESAVRQHQKMVYGIACSFFHNEAIAEEVSQDVFMQLYQHRRTISSGDHCLAWLRRSTVHRCIDVQRRASFHQEVQVEELPEIAEDLRETDPLLMEGLQRLIASLPATPRSVLILRFAEDMGAEDIGRALNMPVRTVWSHLQRATSLIREKAARYLKENDDEPLRTRSS